MMLSDLIYSPADPCVDIYYSVYYSELLLGARRLTHDNQLMHNYHLKRLAAWPSNSELGEIILTELTESSQKLLSSEPATTSSRASISSASSEADFERSFWYFAVWTKPDVTVPLFIGAPIAVYYSDAFNRRAIDKFASTAHLGAAVQGFILEVTTELKKAGLPHWK